MSGEEGQPSSYYRRNTERTTTKTSRPSYVRRRTDPGRSRPSDYTNGVESSNNISKNRNTTSNTNTKKKKSKNTIKQQQPPNRQESRLLVRQRSKHQKPHDKVTAKHNRLQKHMNDKTGRQNTQKLDSSNTKRHSKIAAPRQQGFNSLPPSRRRRVPSQRNIPTYSSSSSSSSSSSFGSDSSSSSSGSSNCTNSSSSSSSSDSTSIPPSDNKKVQFTPSTYKGLVNMMEKIPSKERRKTAPISSDDSECVEGLTKKKQVEKNGRTSKPKQNKSRPTGNRKIERKPSTSKVVRRSASEMVPQVPPNSPNPAVQSLEDEMKEAKIQYLQLTQSQAQLMSDLEREENRISLEKKRADLEYISSQLQNLKLQQEIIHRSVLSQDENQTYSDIDDDSSIDDQDFSRSSIFMEDESSIELSELDKSEKLLLYHPCSLSMLRGI